MSSETNIWMPDPDPWTAALESGMTALGTAFLTRVHRSVTGELELPRPDPLEISAAFQAVIAKSREESWYTATRLLENLRGYGDARLPPSQHRALADAVTEKWYAEGRLETRAERHAVAAQLVGAIRAGDTPRSATLSVQALPERSRRTAEFASARAGEHMRNLSAKTRHALTATLYDAELANLSPRDLERTLLERFATLNRDWRRVAITEIAMNRANGQISACELGEPLEWSAARDACKNCRHHHGKRYTVTDSGGNPETDIWIGKPPPPKGFDPRAWPVIPLHPSCRCNFMRVLRPPAGVNPEIEAMVQNLIAQTRA